MENNVVSEYLLGIEIDGVKQGVVKVANPSPQTIELEQKLFGKGKDKQAEIQYSCGFVAGWLSNR